MTVRHLKDRWLSGIAFGMCFVDRFFLSSMAGLFLVCAACEPSFRPGLPPDSPFAETQRPVLKLFSDGLAVGDVSDRSAVIWARTSEPAKVTIEHWQADETRERIDARRYEKTQVPRATLETDASHDYTLHYLIENLQPATHYVVRIQAGSGQAAAAQPSFAPPKVTEELHAEFRTLTAPSTHEPVTFGWSGDIGGQGRCRQGETGYPVFDAARMASLDFFLLLGDTVYADETCPSPPNVPGSDFLAANLDAYRAKHRYQRGASALQRFLASVPVYVVWDDHEVRNNFAGPFDPYMPVGRQALLDYWPIGTSTEAPPSRLYRRVRAGADLEIFILDTRQYRSRNNAPDGPSKTMLGREQLTWMLDGLEQSRATWKVIASTVPLSVPKAGLPHEPGNDGWAGGGDGTGFETELKFIIERIMRGVRNVVWLTADVHFVQANAYDVDGDGTPDFHEFVAGPLSAATKHPVAARSPFPVRTLTAEGGYFNFGKVRVDAKGFEVSIIDDAGTIRFKHRISAR